VKRGRLPARAAAVLLMSCPFVVSHAADTSATVTERGRMLFTGGATPACAICHTLANADAAGAVGPSLDELKPDAARVEAVLRKGMGVMPAYPTLSEEDIKALSTYVSQAAGGS
jgi:mono/diheme cytochrome c family protein